MLRRDLFKYGIGGGAGILAAGFLARLAGAENPMSHHRSQAQGPPVDSFTYQGHKVDIIPTPRGQAMVLDGRQLPDHVFLKIKKGYASHMLPFGDFRTGRALAMDLIDGNGLLFDL